MDKRTIIFILGMTIIFYFLHEWFEVGAEKPTKTPVAKPKTEIQISGKGQPTLLSEKDMKEFHIVKLFSDINFKNFVTYAIVKDDNYLTISSDINYPEEIYSQESTGNISIPRRLELRIKPKQVGDPVLYSVFPLAKLSIPWIPAYGTYPVFVIYFEDGKAYKVNGATIGYSKVVLEHTIPENAIVLFEYENEIRPYAIYQSNLQHIEYLDRIKDFEDYAYLTFPERLLETEKKDQKYYVLENEFMQLVFSNFNGAIAEINLPFESEKNPNSIVRKIEFDRIIESDYPNNATFPQFSYFVPDGNKGTKQMQPQRGGYYPLLRRNIIGSGGNTTTWINPHFYALSVFESDSAPDTSQYQLKRFEKNLIEFELVTDKRRITKTFSFPSDIVDAPYCFNLSIKVEGDARPLYVQLGIPEVELISGSFSPILKYSYQQGSKVKVEQIKLPKEPIVFSHIEADWYLNGNGFFGVILDPLNRKPGLKVLPISGELAPSRLTMIDSQYQRYPPSKYPGYSMQVPVDAKSLTTYRIYAGPVAKVILNRVDETYTDSITGYNPDYTAAQSYLGWFAFISQPFSKLLFAILDFFYNLTHSWGFSIILLTIVLRIMLYPLNNWSMKSTAKLQKLSPKIQEIQEKYKKDPKRAQLEIMNLYKREGANPFGGCLPLIIQLPFLFGMFDLLKSTFRLRGASFIPGWIDDLAAPDVLFSWNYPIPFIGTDFHLLPILLGVIMYFQQKLTSAANTQKPVTDQQRQQKMMGNIMTIVFTVLFYHFPAGLNIYWISSMLLGILQQWWVNKQIQVKTKVS